MPTSARDTHRGKRGDVGIAPYEMDGGAEEDVGEHLVCSRKRANTRFAPTVRVEGAGEGDGEPVPYSENRECGGYRRGDVGIAPYSENWGCGGRFGS